MIIKTYFCDNFWLHFFPPRNSECKNEYLSWTVLQTGQAMQHHQSLLSAIDFTKLNQDTTVTSEATTTQVHNEAIDKEKKQGKVNIEGLLDIGSDSETTENGDGVLGEGGDDMAKGCKDRIRHSGKLWFDVNIYWNNVKFTWSLNFSWVLFL